jgi:glutamate carboxypeptidase
MILMRSILRDLQSKQSEMVRLLRRMVETESPSYDKAAVDRVGRLVAAEWRKRGARVQLLHQRERGDHVRAEWNRGARGGKQILVIGHLDTVYDLGTLRRMPFRARGGWAYGPGTYDMKGGLTIALFAVDALRRARISPPRRVVFLWTTDEEIGSGTSRTTIEREARRSEAVLVLEPATGPDGRLKTARKGVGEAEIIVHGRAAHAGVNPAAGVNAVHELALQIAQVMKLNAPERGISVNVDVVEGGTRTNVIAERARGVVDLRIARLTQQRPLEKKLRALRPILRDAKIEVRGGIDRPPMERSAGVVRLFRHAQVLADDLGIPLEESSTGGGSDGNFTAALGVPTLDGLGAVGEGAHSPGERVRIAKLPERAALLAGLLATL